MDHWGPKHVELPNVMNKLNHKTLCILLDYIYAAINLHLSVVASKFESIATAVTYNV